MSVAVETVCQGKSFLSGSLYGRPDHSILLTGVVNNRLVCMCSMCTGVGSHKLVYEYVLYVFLLLCGSKLESFFPVKIHYFMHYLAKKWDSHYDPHNSTYFYMIK